MDPIYNPLNRLDNKEVKDEHVKNEKDATDIKINKLFISKRRNSLDTSTDNELPRVVEKEDSRNSIEKVRVRRNSLEQIRDRKGSREIFIKFSPRTELEFAKNS